MAQSKPTHLSGDQVEGIVLRGGPLLVGGPLPSRPLGPHVSVSVFVFSSSVRFGSLLIRTGSAGAAGASHVSLKCQVRGTEETIRGGSAHCHTSVRSVAPSCVSEPQRSSAQSETLRPKAALTPTSRSSPAGPVRSGSVSGCNKSRTRTFPESWSESHQSGNVTQQQRKTRTCRTKNFTARCLHGPSEYYKIATAKTHQLAVWRQEIRHCDVTMCKARQLYFYTFQPKTIQSVQEN